MLKLVIEHSATGVWVVDKSFTIGRNSDNHLVLNQSHIGEFHARILFDGKKHLLRDLGTESGTYVNDQRITQRPIFNFDVIRIGDLSLKVLDPLYPGNQQEWCLVGSANWLAGQAFALPFAEDKDTVKIGRSATCDVIFPGVHLPKEHVALKQQGNRLELRNLNTANAIYINERQVMDISPLTPGDELRLDICVFQLFGPIAPRTQDLAQNRKHLIPSSAKSKSAEEHVQKQWKTRSTSPGNRDEADQTPNPMNSPLLWFSVAAAVVGLFLLGAYIWFG